MARWAGALNHGAGSRLRRPARPPGPWIRLPPPPPRPTVGGTDRETARGPGPAGSAAIRFPAKFFSGRNRFSAKFAVANAPPPLARARPGWRRVSRFLLRQGRPRPAGPGGGLERPPAPASPSRLQPSHKCTHPTSPQRGPRSVLIGWPFAIPTAVLCPFSTKSFSSFSLSILVRAVPWEPLCCHRRRSSESAPRERSEPRYVSASAWRTRVNTKRAQANSVAVGWGTLCTHNRLSDPERAGKINLGVNAQIVPRLAAIISRFYWSLNMRT